MISHARSTNWREINQRVYWDRTVDLETWRAKIKTGHRSYFPDAVARMSVREFIYFYGENEFARDWPRLRQCLPKGAMTGMYDLNWSVLVGAGLNLRPFSDFYSLPKRRREFLMQVSRTPGKNIYEICALLKMQYRRGHEHAKQLMKSGKVRGKLMIEKGRRKTLLYPGYQEPDKQ